MEEQDTDAMGQIHRTVSLSRDLIDKIASDFKVLDRWEVPLQIKRGERYTLDEVLNVALTKRKDFHPLSLIAGFLFWFRELLGTSFGWDRDVNTLPIPGCEERSLKARLAKASISSDDPCETPIQNNDLVQFRMVYHSRQERLQELSNNTVHGLLHYILEQQDEKTLLLRLTILVKTRGRLGRFYMALIMPFRHLFVYPALVRNIKKSWVLKTNPD